MRIQYLYCLLLLSLSSIRTCWASEGDASFIVPRLESLDSPFNLPNSRMIKESDIIGHPYYNESLREFIKIVPVMHRAKQFASFHSCQVYVEIGSYCGATMILAQNATADLKVAVSIDMLQPGTRGVSPQDQLTSNLGSSKFNPHGARIYQVAGNSRETPLINTVTRQLLAPGSVDLLFIDGDHFNPAPDFHNFQNLVRPGGLVVWDDYGNHRTVKGVVNKIARDSAHCWNILGSISNVALANVLSHKGTKGAAHRSNEFIMQRKWNCGPKTSLSGPIQSQLPARTVPTAGVLVGDVGNKATSLPCHQLDRPGSPPYTQVICPVPKVQNLGPVAMNLRLSKQELRGIEEHYVQIHGKI